jgi:hypothetical protein
MAEEQVVEKQEESVVETPKLSEVEELAFKEGWRPKEEFDGDDRNTGKEWIPADEFLRRKPLFARIDDLKAENYHTRKELQEVKQGLRQLADHHRKVRETEYKRAVDDLKAAKRDAIEDQNGAAVVKIDEQLDEIKQEHQEFEQQIKVEQKQQQTAPSPEFLTWAQKNPWYQTDQDMHTDADAIAVAFVQKAAARGQAQTLTHEQVYNHVTEKIRKLYPEKFEGTKPMTTKPSPVDSGRSGTAPVKKETFQLTEEQEAMCRTFIRQGAIKDRQHYIDELKKVEGK